MTLILNVILLLLFISFGIIKLTRETPEKRTIILNGIKDAPKNFYKNCKIVLEKVKNKEL